MTFHVWHCNVAVEPPAKMTAQWERIYDVKFTIQEI